MVFFNYFFILGGLGGGIAVYRQITQTNENVSVGATGRLCCKDAGQVLINKFLAVCARYFCGKPFNG